MKRIFGIASLGLALAVAGAGLSTTTPAFADPPAKAEKNRGKKDKAGANGSDLSVNVSLTFSDSDRLAIRNFYANPTNCPPGLAKKNNGCQPPGQAKKWALGRPLPRDVIYHALPPALSVQLRVPPEGYKYVRVAADILMIAVGTGMVVSAVEDLARM